MQNLNSMSCPTCGGRTEIASTSSQFICAYCGSKWSISKSESGTVPPVSVNRIAIELTISRLQKEIDDLIVTLLMETEDREALREHIEHPAPRFIAGELVQMAGFILLVFALVWAVVGIQIAQGKTQVAPLLIAACLPLFVAACIITIGMLQSRREHQRLRQIEQDKAHLRDLRDQSRARSQQMEQLLQEKREQLDRQKLIASS